MNQATPSPSESEKSPKRTASPSSIRSAPTGEELKRMNAIIRSELSSLKKEREAKALATTDREPKPSEADLLRASAKESVEWYAERYRKNPPPPLN